MAPEQVSEPRLTIFELQAHLGFTKHMGGLNATQELIELCHVDEGDFVLDIGCGVGLTTCYIAKTIGCRVVGVDISEGMIERSNERAARERVEDRVEFRVADAQALPFEDDLFDVVVGESVLAFTEDQLQAASEFARVAKPGGYVGVNESVWVKDPPSALVAALSRSSGVGIEVLFPHDLRALLEGSGLRVIVARTHKVTALSDTLSQIRRLGLAGLATAWYRAFRLYISRPGYREFVKEGLSQPKEIVEYMGYGVYVGRK